MSQKTVKKLLIAVLLLFVFVSVASITIDSRNGQSISHLRSAGPLVEVNTTKGKFDVTACKNVLESVLSDFSEFLSALDRVILHGDTSLRRGLSNGKVIYLRCLEDRVEFENVLIHELAHVIDLSYLAEESKNYKSRFTDFGRPIYLDDISTLFYMISWKDNTTLHLNTVDADFVSEYGKTDPFEDFAESLITYRQYGDYFRHIIEVRESSALQHKYDFIKMNVFKGKEFDSKKDIASLNSLYALKNIYDATKMHQVK